MISRRRIIPATDTPGAAEAGVPAFIDLLFARWADEDERRRVLDGLDSLGAADGGAGFLALDADERTRLLGGLDEEAVRARKEDRDALLFFATLKEWTLAGYYTSEAGATRELRWIAAPGGYDADTTRSSYMALTACAAAYAVDARQRGELPVGPG